ncbi:MAG: transketolase, partial [Cyclobacteriaceae bacterium]|nr:transketolase [Cyclobacteriaceae bacterium]
HSTSGSHERYKSKERLKWEKEYDCNKKLKEYIIESGFATADELHKIELNARHHVKNSKDEAWNEYTLSIQKDVDEASHLLEKVIEETKNRELISRIKMELDKTVNPLKSDVVRAIKKSLRVMRGEELPSKTILTDWLNKATKKYNQQYSSRLYSESKYSALKVPVVQPTYHNDSMMVDGREVLLACFDAALKRDPKIFAFGEDVGKIGDVNQAFAGLQEKYGDLRVTDTSIREMTIIGQGIGAALRGLRPIAEIQYLDYLAYALATINDDLACLQYRTYGGQRAPLIIRTRGHRLEGIWHSGSPMSMILGSMRGVYILTPRNMTQAAGMYNTLFRSDDPALMIESLNGYRLKERIPENIGDFTVPLGHAEVLKEGDDITIVTYGSMCRIVQQAARQLQEVGISCEIIDVQTLIPFDLSGEIVKSVKKTNRVLFADEDVPGGASAYMMQKVLDEENAYYYLDSKPEALAATEHRPAYGSDGDYFSKPNVEDVFDKVYAMMHEADPVKYPEIY